MAGYPGNEILLAATKGIVDFQLEVSAMAGLPAI
jgi:hypothetical protein